MSVSQSSTVPPLRVALIGYGLAGAVFHAPLIAATPGLQIAAIVTSQPERQQQAKTRYPDAQIVTNVEDIWRQRENYDLAVVATPNQSHVPLGLASLQAGLPVVIDKPLAASVTEAQLLIATSERTGVPFTVFQNRRWDNDFLTVRKLLAADILGPVTRYESRFERYRSVVNTQAWRESSDPAQSGGLLYDLGSHLIDQALVLFGQPTHVYAELAQRRPGTQVDDDTFVALHFANGVDAHLWMSVVARNGGPRLRISGLRGTYIKQDLDPQEERLRKGATPADPGWGQEAAEHWGHISTDIAGLHIDGTIETVPGAYPYFYSAVRDALLHKTPWPVDPHEVLSVLRIIEAAQQSARSHQVISV